MANKHEFFGMIDVAPFGVLGTRLNADGSVSEVAPPPDGPAVVIVDPAGLHHIQGVPKGAGGAAGSIYRWLGAALPEDEPFPARVRDEILTATHASRYCYADGKKCVIHAVGPNFNDASYDTMAPDEAYMRAKRELAATYANVLREFAVHLKPEVHDWRHDEYDHNKVRPWGTLRILPISSGIFSGRFKDVMPTLTAEALEASFSLIPQSYRRALAMRTQALQMCVFDEREVAAYSAAIEVARARTQDTTTMVKVLDDGVSYHPMFSDFKVEEVGGNDAFVTKVRTSGGAYPGSPSQA